MYFSLLVLAGYSRKIFSQIYTANQWYLVTKKIENDSIFSIERLAAFKFHVKINKYRNDNELPSLKWDEALWLAARNHTVWMNLHNNLMHSEMVNTKYFSGETPNDRIAYVFGSVNHSRFTGENALYNFSAFGKTINEIAENISEESFNDWKNSTGHNKNMLENFNIHAVAFILSGKKVWATNLLCKSNLYYVEREGVLMAFDVLNNATEKNGNEIKSNKTVRKKTLTTSNIRTEITLNSKKYITENSALKINKKFNDLAKGFADKLIQNNKLNDNTDNIYYKTEKIKLNSSGKKNIFTALLNRKNQLLKTEILIEKDKNLFDITWVQKQITEIVSKQNVEITKANIGYFVNVKLSKNIYKVAFVVVVG